MTLSLAQTRTASVADVRFNIVSRDADEPTAICAICHERVPVELILGHLAGAHDLDVEVETWPDGSPVIVDSTLQPDDFARGTEEGGDRA